MKTIKLLVVALLFAFIGTTQAQTAEEIIANYFENTGGLEKWNSVEGIKMEGSISIQGMDLPMTMVKIKDGRQMGVAEFQGMKFYQDVFDGKTVWSTNQQTMAAEKADAERTANMKLEMNDMVDPLLGYKEKGYDLELLGKETIEGTETYKVKLTKEPIMADGKEVPSVSYYYFDTENFVPIVIEQEIMSGQGKGMVGQVKLSDYQEVDGLYFPFSTMQGVKGQPGGMEMKFKKITLNPEITDDMFAFPEKK